MLTACAWSVQADWRAWPCETCLSPTHHETLRFGSFEGSGKAAQALADGHIDEMVAAVPVSLNSAHFVCQMETLRSTARVGIRGSDTRSVKHGSSFHTMSVCAGSSPSFSDRTCASPSP